MTNERTKIEGMTPELPGDQNRKDQLSQAEAGFRAERPLNIPQAEAKHIDKGPEKDRVYELNAEFLNKRLENYVEQIHSQEKERVEKKYGKGLWGKLNRWLEESDWGKGVKVGLKVLGGGFATGAALVGSAGLAAPLALSLGARSVVDGILEGIQYLKERGTIQDIKNLKNQRLTAAYNLASLRNDMQSTLTNSQRESLQITEGTPIPYGTRLEDLITQTAQVEEQILSREKNLNLSQKRWKIGRFIAGLATTGLTAAYMGIYGIKLGVRDLDKLKASAEVMSGGKLTQLVPYPAGSSIDQAHAFLTPSHETRLYLDGLNFIYNSSDKITNSVDVTQIARAGGTLTHLIDKGWSGAHIPAGLYTSCVASIAGLSAAAAKEIVDMVKLGKLSNEDMKAAIMSLRKTPRNTIAGANQEISPNIITPTTKFFENIHDNEIWNIHGNDPKQPNSSEPENYFKIKSKDDARNEIKLIKINKNSGDEEGNEITIRANDFYNLKTNNKNIYKKIGESFESIKSEQEQKQKTTWEKWLNDNGIQQGFYITLDSNILNNSRGNPLQANRDYKITEISPDKGIIRLEHEEDRVLNGKRSKRTIITNINLDDLKNALDNHSDQISLGQITESETTHEVTNQNFENFLNQLLTKNIITEEDKQNISLGKSIFEYEDEPYVIDRLTPNQVFVSKVDNNDKILKGAANREVFDMNDFTDPNDLVFTNIRAKKR